MPGHVDDLARVRARSAYGVGPAGFLRQLLVVDRRGQQTQEVGARGSACPCRTGRSGSAGGPAPEPADGRMHACAGGVRTTRTSPQSVVTWSRTPSRRVERAGTASATTQSRKAEQPAPPAFLRRTATPEPSTPSVGARTRDTCRREQTVTARPARSQPVPLSGLGSATSRPTPTPPQTPTSPALPRRTPPTPPSRHS